jgi:predicted transcriptional regulator
MPKIRSVMTKEVFTVTPDTNIIEAAGLIASKSVSILVVGQQSKPVAVISERDIIKGILNKKTKVKDIMSSEFRVISPNDKFAELSKSVRTGSVKRFPVVENDRLVGLITETDVIETTRDFTRIDQIIQEVILAVFGLATAFFLFYFSPLGASVFR